MKNFNPYIERKELSVFKEFFLEQGQCKTIRKKSSLVDQHSLIHYGGYVESGMFRYVCTDKEGNEHIVGYVFAGEYVGDYPSCIRNVPSLVTIQAAMDSQVYCVQASLFKKFLETDHHTQKVWRILAEELFVQTYTRLLDVYTKSTEEQYLELIRRCPNFQNYITLKEVASFLRVTPETISHIRKKIQKETVCVNVSYELG